MTALVTQSHNSSVKARLNEVLNDISLFVETASEEQQRRVLTALEDLQESERREYPRKPCSMHVTYTTQDLLASDTIRNISIGGAFIETSAPLSVGDQITVWFSLPARQEPILITGEIAWTPSRGIGVKFISPLSEDLEEMIEAL